MTRTIGGYTVLEPLGRGGMGVVYLAEQVALGRPVALKVIAPELAQDADFRGRFQREYRTAASIDHPNVVTVYEAGESDGVLFIAMQLVRGEDLRELVRRERGLDPARAAALVAQVGNGLDAAHAAGLVHRDVKPANVLVSYEGDAPHAYLSDFGLTKHVTSHGGLTRTGQWVGTVDYLAPELVEGRSADARSDVYSLGCLLYETLTGQVPFPRDAHMAKLYAHVQAEPPVPSALRAGLAAGLDDVVLRALAKRPEDRPQSAGDLGRQAMAAVAGGSTPPLQGSVAAGAAAPFAERSTVRPAPAPPRVESPPPGRTPPPGQTPPPGSTPPPTLTEGRRRGSGGMAMAIVVAAAILTLGGVGAALIATGAIGGKDEKPAVATSVPQKTITAVEASSSSGSQDAPAATDVELESYVSPSYNATLPAGWTVEKDFEDMGAFYETRRTNGEMTILIDTTLGSSGDPRQTAVDQEATGDPSYRRLRWRYFDLNGVQAFEWAFAKDGERRDDILFYLGGDGYGVLGKGPPGKYRDVLALTRRVADSVQPR